MAQQCGVTKNRVKCALPLLGFCTAVIGILHCRYWDFALPLLGISQVKKSGSNPHWNAEFSTPPKTLKHCRLNRQCSARRTLRLPLAYATLRRGTAYAQKKKKKRKEKKGKRSNNKNRKAERKEKNRYPYKYLYRAEFSQKKKN